MGGSPLAGSGGAGPRLYVGVVGSAACDPHVAALAEEVGRLLAEAGAVLVCGGRGGVMEAASRGAAEAGGLVVGILPDEDRLGANPHLTVSVPTGLGQARNALVALSSHAVIAISGGYGTLSEIGHALKLGVPVVGLKTWELLMDGRPDPAILRAESPSEAVELALRATRPPGRGGASGGRKGGGPVAP